MTDENPPVLALGDPLGEPTRNERRSLLGASALGLFIAHAHIIPTKITALGVEFTLAHQRTIVVLLALLVAYFFSAFAVYAAADFVRSRLVIHEVWMKSFRRAVRPEEREQLVNELLSYPETLAEPARRTLNRRVEDHWRMVLLSGPVSIARACLEFLVPLVIGISAISSLLRVRI